MHTLSSIVLPALRPLAVRMGLALWLVGAVLSPTASLAAPVTAASGAAIGVGAGAAIDNQALIDQKQRVLDRREAVELQDCRSRFAVSDCVAEVQRRHRAASKPLRERQLRLEDAEREHKAELRRQAIADKARTAAAPAASAPPTDLRLRKPRPPLADHGRPVGAASPAAAVPAPDPGAIEAARRRAESDAQRAAERHQRERETQRAEGAAAAAARAQAAKARGEQAEAARARIAARQAERAANGHPPAAPLPVPYRMPAVVPSTSTTPSIPPTPSVPSTSPSASATRAGS